MRRAIAYYRVSTTRQGRSGLGLEAQQSAVEHYCSNNEYELLTSIVEIKSTKKWRERLFETLSLCRQNQATLIVARLDRLGRDVEQIARLVKSNVEIIVVDNPHANRFTIHILAAVAEEQRQRISDTTKEALQAAKKRGVKLGANGIKLSIANKEAANVFAAKLVPLLNQLKAKGIVTVRAISKELNKRNIPTFREGGKWHPSTVCLLLHRIESARII